MSRARRDGTGAEQFGYYKRALVTRKAFGLPEGDWWGHRPGKLNARRFRTWREAMDYALGGDS